MLLGPLSAAFGVMANPIPRGCIELPAAYGEHVWGMFKGTHKYIKRVPIGTTATGKTRYRYYYNVGHGGGIGAHEHMVEGAKFAHGDGHFHIVKQDGDKLHVRNTATGEEHTITKQALAQKLAEHHAEGLKAYRDRAAKALAEAKANKASPKQIAKLEERVKRAGGSKATEAPKPSAEHMDKVKTMRVSQLEWPANNPRHPMHEAAKAELERREKLVTPQQAIEIARKALAIERRQADGGEAGRRAHTSKDDDAALEAFSALTPNQQKTAMDALGNEGKKPAPESKPSTRADRSRETQRETAAPKPSDTVAPKRVTKVYLTDQARSVINELGKKDHYRHSFRDMDEIKAIKGAIKNGHFDVSGMDPKDADALAWSLQRKGEHMISSNRNESVGRQIVRAAKSIRGEPEDT